MNSKTKVCFVVMGFGRKTDFESGKTFDLNATYEAIIKPSAEAEGFRCIRADEVLHSGIIDTQMYQLLFQADLVIADISTSNPNAIYELGVRHALKRNSTIILKMEDSPKYFDFDHTFMFPYKHLGDDIGVREAKRAVTELRTLIKSTIIAEKPDSPVYTFLPKLNQPYFSKEEVEDMISEAEEFGDTLRHYMQKGDEHINKSDFISAIENFTRANKMRENDPYILQQLALATYKSKLPSELLALTNALLIINKLNPEESNDPETLGLTGAIYKRLWSVNNDIEMLNKAISFYKRGFEIRRDYYNGDNLAQCYELRISSQTDNDSKLFDRFSARDVRTRILLILEDLLDGPEFDERSDKRWIFATFASCKFALGDIKSGESYEEKFLNETKVEWEQKTYFAGKQNILAIHTGSEPRISFP